MHYTWLEPPVVANQPLAGPSWRLPSWQPPPLALRLLLLAGLCTASWLHGATWAKSRSSAAPVKVDAPLWLMGTGAGAFGEVEIVAHYPDEVASVCPGGLSVSSSLDGFHKSTRMGRRGADEFVATVNYSKEHAGATVQLTFMINAGLYEHHIDPACMSACPSFSAAGQQAWGPPSLLALPSDGSRALFEAWPAFCQVEQVLRVDEVWSTANQRAFNISTTLPSSLLENRLPRAEVEMPSIVFRLDGQYFWPVLPGNGDTFLSTLALVGATKPLLLVDVDFSLHGDSLWRHPYLVPTPLKSCPADSDALRFLPSLRKTWEQYTPSYLKLNKTYGFGQADALLDFLLDELLPFLAEEYLPPAPHGRPLRLRDLDVGLWGISDAGYTAWYGAWKRPGDVDVAIMQTPLVLWNCGEALDEVLRNGRAWASGKGGVGPGGPRFYMDHGDQEDPHAYAAPVDSLHQALKDLGLQDGQDLFLVRGEGDGHFGNAFYRRAYKAILTLYGADSRRRQQLLGH